MATFDCVCVCVCAWTYRGKGAQYFDPVLGRERVRRVHGGEVGQSGGGICRGPAQYVTQLWRVGIDGVPRHQELMKKTQRGKNINYSSLRHVDQYLDRFHYNAQHTPPDPYSCIKHDSHMMQGHELQTEGVLTSLQRKGCLLVTEVTGINKQEMSRRIFL